MTMQIGWSIDVFGERGRLITESPTFPTSRDCTPRGGQLGGALEDIAIPHALKTAPGVTLDWQSHPQPSYPMALSMQAMVAAIRGEGAASPDFAEALEVERLQQAVRMSSEERRWIAIADVT
jgi:predicted dehydrogenase